jgi:hypothetical protein
MLELSIHIVIVFWNEIVSRVRSKIDKIPQKAEFDVIYDFG